MEIKLLRKFQDNHLLNEIMVYECMLEIRKSGKASFDFNIKSKDSECLISMWTSNKDQIETRIQAGNNLDNIFTVDSVGNLENLSCYCTSVHLEHMDRGHYWLCLNTSNKKLTIDFITRGYLKILFKS